MKVLFSWVGFRDLTYIGRSLGTQFSKELEEEKKTHPSACKTSSFSPIEKIIEKAKQEKKPFGKLVLFFDMKRPVLREGLKKYYGQLVPDVVVFDTEFENTHRYEKMRPSFIGPWQRIRQQLGEEIEPCFNLESGTMAMKALFIVIGTSVYDEKAHFIQVSSTTEEAEEEYSINFDFGSYALNEALRPDNLPEFDSIIGRSPQITRVKRMAQKAAKTDCNILIYGESGTGKELLANAIHQASTRKDKPFQKINCAAIPAPLLESLLFGHKKGAFTGADKDSPGLFKECDGGTLFLDEAEACAPEMQVKLLRVLQPPSESALTCRKFTPIGSTKEEESDVRIIAATNERLDRKEEFRSDFLNRLSTLTLSLPALRERPEDLRELAQRLFDAIKKQLGEAFKHKKLTDSAIKFIESRAWYGNVRELQNALTQAIVFGESDKVTDADFDPNLPKRLENAPVTGTPSAASSPDEIDLSQPIDLSKIAARKDAELKKRYIDAALKKTGGIKRAAADLLCTSYQNLDNWIRGAEKILAQEE